MELGSSALISQNAVELGSDVRVSLNKSMPSWKNPSVEYITADLEKAEDCLRICKDIDHLIIASANSSGATCYG